MTFPTFPATASAAWAIPGLKKPIDLTQQRMKEIKRLTCEYYNLKESIVFNRVEAGRKRKQVNEQVTDARQVGVYLITKHCKKVALSEMARQTGYKNHTCVINCKKRVTKQLEAKHDNNFKTAVHEIESKLQAQWQ